MAPIYQGFTLNPTKALIVEDVASTLEWLEQTLDAAFPNITVFKAKSCAETLAQLDQLAVDLVLLDLGLPDGSGLDLIAPLRTSQGNDCNVVITTIFDDDEHLLKALQQGANGYLLKDDDTESFVKQLQGLLSNRPPVSTRSLSRILDTLQPNEAPGIELTSREQDVLQLVAKGFSVAESATMLGLTTNTVNSYLKTIYTKLEIGSRAEATAEAIRRGLITP